MNKRGEDKMIAMYWFAILFLVTGAIVAMVSLFYGHPLDVREAESQVLLQRFSDCLSREGVLNSRLYDEGFFDSFGERLLEECSLSFSVDEYVYGEDSQYYVGADLYVLLSPGVSVHHVEAGNLNLLASCNSENAFDTLAYCSRARLYVTGGDAQYLVEVTSIVRKAEQNVV